MSPRALAFLSLRLLAVYWLVHGVLTTGPLVLMMSLLGNAKDAAAWLPAPIAYAVVAAIAWVAARPLAQRFVLQDEVEAEATATHQRTESWSSDGIVSAVLLAAGIVVVATAVPELVQATGMYLSSNPWQQPSEKWRGVVPFVSGTIRIGVGLTCVWLARPGQKAYRRAFVAEDED